MFEALIDRYGDSAVLAMTGAFVGLIFGSAAQHSRFCLRAAVVEVAQGNFGPRLSIWLVAFCAAVAAVQGAIAVGWLDVSDSRQLATVGSLSGATIGGLMFGAGMILARGCASRLLVLSATGNLRAIVTGLVLTLVAQSALRGVISPMRESLTALWTIDGGATRDLLSLVGMDSGRAVFVFSLGLFVALNLARFHDVKLTHILAALLVGFSVAGGWIMTYQIAQNSFEVIEISSVTFTGPSADTLMGLVNNAHLPLNFGIGLVPGVFIGSGVMALFTGEAKIQRFGPDAPMERYLIGATFMGFGSMLAGGCAVGAGMSGGAVFSATAWLAIFCMWLGALGTHILLERIDMFRRQSMA